MLLKHIWTDHFYRRAAVRFQNKTKQNESKRNKRKGKRCWGSTGMTANLSRETIGNMRSVNIPAFINDMATARGARDDLRKTEE
ncbi:hypothetical protein Baya_14887 [Bagarius yarrelli]|uniref:Uncharacterized protein n=1 Tax=Bagarius yarrelli TaxID=175774 RepID=A0A556VA65_BAGYA|nr:hypothetical protein Baya_14887 [Bagarius yarrelli]